jgi:hypothetical protein
MVVLPTRLKGLTIYPAYGKIVLSDQMTKVECLEAQKLYSDIQWIEKEQPKKKRK